MSVTLFCVWWGICHVYAMAHALRAENNSWETVISFYQGLKSNC